MVLKSLAYIKCKNSTNALLRVIPGFSLIELIVASAVIALVGAGTLAAISFFEQTTVNSSNQKAEKNLLTNVIDEAHSQFTRNPAELSGVTGLTTSSRGITTNAYVNQILSTKERFDGQIPQCAIESVDLANKTFTLDPDCQIDPSEPLAVYNNLEFLNTSSDPAPIHILGATSICAVQRVTASTRTFHLCPNTDACLDTVTNTDCLTDSDGLEVEIGSEVLVPRYLIRESETADSGTPLSYLVESAGVEGPSQISLVVDTDYYDSFNNTAFTCSNSSTCRIPVQESVARNINPDGKIRVASDSLAAYSDDITVTVTAKATNDDPAPGTLAVGSDSSLLTDTDTNDHILTLSGSLLVLNETLETLSYTGDTGIFENVDLTVSLAFGNIEQSTGPNADHIAKDIRLEVFPNCGCEPEGRTAVTFRLGKWDTSTNAFVEQQADGMPLDITTVALQNSDSPATFYGYGQSCVGISKTCTGSTKQQTIAEEDSISLFLYEYNSPSATAANKFSMFFFDDSYDNNCANSVSESGSDTWNAIENGIGTWSTNQNTDGNGNVTRWGCFAEIRMENIPERSPTNPFIRPEAAGGEGADFATTQTYSGNQLPDTVASWGRLTTETTSIGGRSDGFIMTLPITSETSGLAAYTVNSNPRFIVNEYNSLQTWRIRSIRQPSDYSSGTCPSPLPAEENDEMAWLDRSDNEKLSIPQHLWASSTFPNDTDVNIWTNSTNAVELRVQTAKTCPNPGLFE